LAATPTKARPMSPAHWRLRFAAARVAVSDRRVLVPRSIDASEAALVAATTAAAHPNSAGGSFAVGRGVFFTGGGIGVAPELHIRAREPLAFVGRHGRTGLGYQAQAQRDPTSGSVMTQGTRARQMHSQTLAPKIRPVHTYASPFAQLARSVDSSAWARLLCALLVCMPGVAGADSVSSAVYIRSDTDSTLVVSPRVHAAKRLGEPTQVDISYAADIWTSASIDIRTSASLPVTEQRNELDAALSHQLDRLTLSGSYRYSVENDYNSNGATAGATLDLADKNSTLAANVYGFQDTVGRSGDKFFSRDLTTLGARVSFTQVFDANTLGQLTYELVRLQGYQSSPYRFVGSGPGATGYGCMGALQCLPEHQPDLRTRHAAAILLRRGLSDDISLGGNYRFYIDDWGQTSHMLAAQLGWVPDASTLLTLRYRYYTQTGVGFYARVYRTSPSIATFTTRDREQSPLHDHRIAFDVQKRTSIGDKDTALVLNAGVAGDFYSYDDFVGLSAVSALEVTLAVTLER
jgi:hypothetical protein